MEGKEENSMMSAGKTMRISIYTFLKHYQFFTSIASILAIPFSLSLLLSQAISFSLLFPSYNSFFSLITLKLSQTLSSTILTLPFSLSFLLFTKTAVIQYLLITHYNKPNSSLYKVYFSLLSTHLCNSAFIFSVNSACFSLLFLTLSFTNAPILVSTMGAVVYSIALANATVICTVALACSGLEGKGGFKALIWAYTILKNKTSTGLVLAVPTNLGLAAVESLFYFRIIYLPKGNDSSSQLWLLALEGVLIAYLYSILLVLDVISSCFFYQSCKDDLNAQTYQEIEEDEDGYHYFNLEKLEEFV